MTKSASSLPPFEGPPPPAKLSPSFSAEATSFLAAEAMVDLSTFIRAEKAACKAFLFVSTSFSLPDVSCPLTAFSKPLAAESPIKPRKDGTVERK